MRHVCLFKIEKLLKKYIILLMFMLYVNVHKIITKKIVNIYVPIEKKVKKSKTLTHLMPQKKHLNNMN